MRHTAAALALAFALLMPRPTAGLPTDEPDLSHTNGCVFGHQVFESAGVELQRLETIRITAAKPDLVVLIVEIKSLENLRKSTIDWLRENCRIL